VLSAWPFSSHAAARARLVGLAALALAGLSTIAAKGPLLLWNTTDSEPEGLYVRSPGPMGVGALVAVRVPPAAFPYASRQLSYLRRIPVLKPVAAATGDRVCAESDVLMINGQARARILVHDRSGIRLPSWGGCRRLQSNELFLLSDRIPNSFDSRYFGPVARSAVLGPFQPLVVAGAGR